MFASANRVSDSYSNGYQDCSLLDAGPEHRGCSSVVFCFLLLQDSVVRFWFHELVVRFDSFVYGNDPSRSRGSVDIKCPVSGRWASLSKMSRPISPALLRSNCPSSAKVNPGMLWYLIRTSTISGDASLLCQLIHSTSYVCLVESPALLKSAISSRIT